MFNSRNYLISFLMFTSLIHADMIQREIAHTIQDPSIILNQQPVQYQISPDAVKKLPQQYLTHYFSPWNNPTLDIPYDAVLTKEKKGTAHLLVDTGWDINKKPHTTEWKLSLINNMNLNDFGRNNQKAIVINPTYLRAFPTLSPYYGNPKEAGQGYPFDGFQISYLNADLPLFIVNSSKDGAWKLVVTSDDSVGWIQTQDIAFVSEAFTQKWQHYNSFVFPLQDNAPILDQNARFYFLSRLGEIYPVVNITNDTYEILVAAKDADNQGVIKTAFISKQNAQAWPLKPSLTNVAEQSKKFLGKPYGWGEIYGYRDCSSTVKALFAPFAIWLPRNSLQQAHQAGEFVSIQNLPNEKKKKYIIDNAIPFFTLISLRGHTLLYIGVFKHEVYVLHNPWSMHTKSLILRKEGRDVIGYTLITPLDLGRYDWMTGKNWVSRAISMTYLLPKADFTSEPTLHSK